MKFHAVLFDLDGTLLDTLDDLADSVNAALARLGLPQHSAEAYKYFVGDGMDCLIRRAVPDDRSDAATLAECKRLTREQYAARWAAKTRPYEEIPALLDALTARQVRMTVLSNKPDEFTQLCVARLLAGWNFEVVLGASESVPRKPDPTAALRIAQQLQLQPDQVLYLGDTGTDMQTAVAAGMYPVGVLWGFRSAEELAAHGARVLIHKPLDLLPILDGVPQ